MAFRPRWLFRSALALTGAFAALLSWSDAAAMLAASGKHVPGQALVAHDPRIAASRIDPLPLLLGPADPVHRAVIAANGRDVLRHQPLDVSAVRNIALAESGDGSDIYRARLTMAERLSRRDGASELALFFQAAQYGDIEKAVRHFDRAVSVRPALLDHVAPTMLAMLAAPGMQLALSRQGDRPWFPRIISAALDQSGSRLVAAQILMAARPDLSGDRSWLLRKALAGLVSDKEVTVARRLVGALRPGSAHELDAFGFTAASTDQDFAPISWKLTLSEALRAEWRGNAGVLVTVEPGKSGTAIERITVLEPGSYGFRQVVGAQGESMRPDLAWEASCVSKDRESMFWRQGVPLADKAVAYQSQFTIPPGCAVQRWRLRVLGDRLAMTDGVLLTGLSIERKGR